MNSNYVDNLVEIFAIVILIIHITHFNTITIVIFFKLYFIFIYVLIFF